jgi:hypothetical protein
VRPQCGHVHREPAIVVRAAGRALADAALQADVV